MPNHERPNNNENESFNNNNRIGAKILSHVNYENRHKKIVEPSFNKAREKGEHLPGKNSERRNYAFLSRLENLIAKHGNRAEKKLWQASIKDDLLVEYDDIPESYWESKRQEYRDNGYGSIELTESYKHEIFNQERKLQAESLEKWANYLGDERSPYPLWFKVYAWDGMTKMGKYNREKGKYETRNNTTVAPYPEPDAEILSGIFETVNHYYGNNEKEFYTEEGERNIQLEKIAQSGNFSKIYNAIQREVAPIIEPPEKPEDVHGQWIVYKPGEEDYIARAARGTGWCIASSSVGKHYLEHGTYGDDNDDDYDDYYDDYNDDDDNNYYDEYDEDYNDYSDENDYDGYVNNNNYYDDNYDHANTNNTELKSRFILFHLEDPSTGKHSKNAVASIRLDLDGQVAEISGLKEGQALNDSLIQIVEDKVKTLPGGEEFLPKFADKNELIRLDEKMKNNEDLTKEELEFIYEINRKINTLDTYNTYDPRIKELKARYDLEYALNAGLYADKLASKMDLFGIIRNLDTLISHGANTDQLVSKMDSYNIIDNLDTLIAHSASIEQLVPRLHSYDILKNLDTLISHGANIDLLVSELDSDDITKNLNILISHGANIEHLVSKMHTSDLVDNLDTLISHGANVDVDQLASKMGSYDIIDNLDTLISHGANIEQLVSEMYPSVLVDNLDTLISHGASIDQLVSKMDTHHINRYRDALRKYGAQI